jgi:hypothetical protein
MDIIKKIISIAVRILRFIIIIFIPFIIIAILFIWVNYRKELSLAMSIRGQGEVNYLVIFQNTLELRPTGGFIGNFAEVTLDNGMLKDYTIYNTNVFDYGKPGIDSPEPYKNMLGLQQMQLRDANWAPNFPTTAKQIIDLYELEGGTKNISGVIAVNASILPEILKIIGPISIEAIDEELDHNNILLDLQYELNFGFIEKGISRSDRKEPIKDLAFEIDNRISKSSIVTLSMLADMLLQQANQKHIMFWSINPDVQSNIVSLGWDGGIDINTQKDYLKVVDANLGALKTDYYMKRAIKKDIRECDNDKICSTIIISYNNTAKEATSLNTDYKSYTRVLLPQNAFVNSVTGIDKVNNKVDYSTAYNKKIVGFQILVPVNSTNDITIDYTMPKLGQYELDIQKQSGVDGFDFTFDNNINNTKISEFIQTDKEF